MPAARQKALAHVLVHAASCADTTRTTDHPVAIMAVAEEVGSLDVITASPHAEKIAATIIPMERNTATASSGFPG